MTLEFPWKEELLLREAMQRFDEMRPPANQKGMGPRCPLPQDVELADSVPMEIYVHVLRDRDDQLTNAQRNRRAFLKASVIAGIMALAAIAGWIAWWAK